MGDGVGYPHVEYAERRTKYGILFIFSLFSEYIKLEYVRVPVMFRVNQAKHGIHILVAASHEYVNTYSTRRVGYWHGSTSFSLPPLTPWIPSCPTNRGRAEYR